MKASEETLRKSLEANWDPAQILKQRLSLYREHLKQIDECDKEMEKLIAQFTPRADPKQKPMPEDRKKQQRKRKKTGSPSFNLRTEAYQLFGVDLTQIPGLMTLVFLLFSELGRDMLGGPPQLTLSPGWGFARTTTSAVARYSGAATAA